ncbi:ribosome hibernation-promoting factor, HPF/YfiA family [Propionibacteriaceae bacterium G1746]|uniref:ribosome hibernation-promoting factor, HPF/YfiA family n=1 Tax=Aestuariimicrobium sp. G57 TaxID=3418485 RepID=UPI003C1F2571
MDIIVSGRHCHVSDSIREQVSERIATVERFKNRVQRVEVEFTVNETKGSPDQTVEAEITLRSKGPVVRAEATAEDKMVAFDKAMERLKTQLRRASDRRKHHKGLRQHNGVLSHPDVEAYEPLVEPATEADDNDDTFTVAGVTVTGDGPFVVKEKQFDANPLTLAQALDEMELVGHDFFLYQDADTGRPSVVYRRKAYDYGVIHLNVG